MALRQRVTGLYADLLANILADQQTIELIGNTVVGDQATRVYKYDASSTATHNGTTVISPTSGVGRYLLWAAPVYADAISLTTTGSGAASLTAGALNIPTPTSPPIVYNNTGGTVNTRTAPKIITLSGAVAGGAGNVVFYLTDNGLVGGNALFTNVDYVNPLVNDSTINYSYGWTISGDKKTLTVNTKAALGINVALLSLTLLGVPSNVANGIVVTCVVVGN